MEIINYPQQISKVYLDNVACDFCSQTFDTNTAKNAHILDHFEKELCMKCDQNLLRIGEHLYVLHGTITCIDVRVKQEVCGNVPEEIFCSSVHSDMVDVKHIETDFNQQNDEFFEETQEKVPAIGLFDGTFVPTEPINVSLNEMKLELNEESDENEILTAENQVKLPARGKSQSNRNARENAWVRSVKYRSCDKCGTTNLTKSTFKRHHEIPNYACSECNDTYCKVSQLKKHYHVQHPGIDPNQGFDSKAKCTIADLYARLKIKRYKCTIEGCNEMVSTSSRRIHLAKHHQVDFVTYDCDICKKSLNSLQNIRIHMNTHGAKRKTFSCNVCGTSNITNETLKRHHTKQKFQCQLCEERFCTKRQSKTHHINVHCGGIAPPKKSYLEKSVKKYKCPMEGCNTLVSSNNRRFHLAAKHKVAPTQCDICKKIFSTKSEVKAHILRIHVPSSKKFECEICHNKYLSEATLKWHHKITHIKERNFMCSECGKTFVQKAQLIIHITKHTGEKPYPCTFEGCSKRFRSGTARWEHSRSHTGEKPYDCPVDGCDRRFGYKIDQKRHKFNAHGIYTKKFPCQICSEIFPENMLLKKHMKKHGIQL